MYLLHVLYLFNHQWTRRLFACRGYCECAAMNVYLFKSVFFSFFLDTYPEVGLLDHVEVLLLIF